MSLLTKILLPLALLAPASTEGGFLGVQLADRDGPTVVQVIPNTAAAKSDIKVGDKFVRVDGKETPDVETFTQIVGGHSVGDRVRFDLDRSGHEITLYIVLGKRPADQGGMEEMEAAEEQQPTPLAPRERREGRGGAAAAPEQSSNKPFLGVTVEEDLTVSGLVEDGPAMRAGMREGDRITRVGRAGDLETSDDLLAALEDLKPGQTVSVRVRRGDATETLSVTLGTKPSEDAAAREDRAAAEREGNAQAARAKKAEAEKAATKKAKEEHDAAVEKAQAAKARSEKTADDRAQAEKAQAEKARSEGEAKAGAVRARSEGAGGSDNRDAEVRRLREELRELRDEIRELKELVKKLNK